MTRCRRLSGGHDANMTYRLQDINKSSSGIRTATVRAAGTGARIRTWRE
ncbi:hypothetical protein BSLA_02r1002 [Burkholderia stabilis]|nr:hypothetical protein BSLA_02r1002 [Burkholderia stabilis]